MVSETLNIFLEYMKKSGKIITRHMFERNIELKLKEQSFIDDISPLLSFDFREKHSRFLTTQDNKIFTFTEREFFN